MPGKQTRRKCWFGTDNAYSKKKTSSIKKALEQDTNIIRAIVAIEKGKSAKKRHYQFYIELKNAMTYTAVQKKYFSGDKAHLEKRKGTAWEAWQYCSDTKSDGTHVSNLVTIGDPPEELYTKAKSVWPPIYKRIEDGASMAALRVEFLNTVPRYHKFIADLIYQRDIVQYKNRFRPLNVMWYWGPPRTGKTRGAMELVDAPHLIHRVSDYKNPWDSYDGQEYVLFDEFHGQVAISTMLQLLDDYYPELPCRYNNKIGKYHTVVICSNQSFEDIYETAEGNYFENRETSVAALLHRINDITEFGVDKCPTLVESFDGSLSDFTY